MEKAWDWAKQPENAGNLLRYAGLLGGAIAGGMEFADSYDAVAATNSMAKYAVLFGAGEVLKAYEALRHGDANALQYIGRAASVALPVLAAWHLGDGNYNPALDLGFIVPWAIAQGTAIAGARKQELDLGKEIMSADRECGIQYLAKNAAPEDLARAVGRVRKRIKK